MAVVLAHLGARSKRSSRKSVRASFRIAARDFGRSRTATPNVARALTTLPLGGSCATSGSRARYSQVVPDLSKSRVAGPKVEFWKRSRDFWVGALDFPELRAFQTGWAVSES